MTVNILAIIIDKQVDYTCIITEKLKYYNNYRN